VKNQVTRILRKAGTLLIDLRATNMVSKASAEGFRCIWRTFKLRATFGTAGFDPALVDYQKRFSSHVPVPITLAIQRPLAN
jgi:hypothetical protein